jgi:hypothetical protein
MVVTVTVVCAVLLSIAIGIKRRRDRRELEQHSITPEVLHTLLASNQDVLVYDVRLPLDLLADSEIIPGANRLAPKDIIENPSLIPREKDLVVYCTCVSDETSRAILRRALALASCESSFSRVAWRAGRRRAFRLSRTPSRSAWIRVSDFIRRKLGRGLRVVAQRLKPALIRGLRHG